MTIMGSSDPGEQDAKQESQALGDGMSSGRRGRTEDATSEGGKGTDGTDAKSGQDIFAEENLPNPSTVEDDSLARPREIEISSEEKVRFIDAVVANTRYTRDYSLFGGRMTLTLRSLTVEEVNALATWSMRVGTEDAAGLVGGRYRKYLAAAQCAMVNGVEMPPLEEPLYARLSRDGKTIEEPGWVGRGAYFENMGAGQFQAIMNCIQDFDMRYSLLCRKAEDANFWSPDTP